MKAPPEETWSESRTLANGTISKFPNLDDFLRELGKQGLVSSREALINGAPELIPIIQRHWLKKNQTGCVFASALASRHSFVSWIDEVFLEPHNAGAVTKLCETIAIIAKKSEAVQVILPTLNTPSDLCTFLEILCKNKSWSLSEIPWAGKGGTVGVQTGLRWMLPSGKFVSWVLGFAPFESMPFTRRAPFTSMIWRVGKPGRCPKVAGFPDRPIDVGCKLPSVHLADLPDGLDKTSAVRRLWKTTQENKLNLLAHDPLFHAARAKVTFSLPNECKAALERIIQQPTAAAV